MHIMYVIVEEGQSDCDEGWRRDEEMKKNEVRKEGKRGL